ncbi:MAG: hypothetical protein KKC68_05880 [Candidatus Thermoplasmatota archaeon]|nr:hypothetical protein [Candidatus Thermoplasmatota archaeon]
MSFTDTQVDILFKLWRNRCFGKGHMLIDNLLGGFPSHIKDHIQEELNDLIKKNFVIKKPSKHGKAVFINYEYKDKIADSIKKKYSFL